MSSPKSAKSGLWKPIVLIALVITVLILARTFGLGERLGELKDWIQSFGRWGPAVFLLVYIAAVVAALPGSAITVAVAAIYGSVLGMIIVSLGATIGAALCFLIARYFARESLQRWLAKKEKFRELDALTEKHGAIIVAVTRLVPLFPFNLLNYGFGLTRVRFWTYVFWSWLCMLPGTALYVVGTDVFTTSLEEGQLPWPLLLLLVLILGILGLLGYMAKRKLKAK